MLTRIQAASIRRPINIEFDPIFLEMVMRSNPSLIFVKDEQSRLIYANQALINLYAPELRDEIIGNTMFAHRSASEVKLIQEEDSRAFREGKSEIVEEITDYKGQKHIFMVKKTVFRATNGMHLLLGIGTDITDLAMRERDLVKSNAMLENFAALAAHDLRTPLSSFSGYLSLILYDKNNRLTPAATRYVAMMQDSLTSLSEQINCILNTYKARYNHEVDFFSTDLNILCEEAKFNLGNLIADSRASIISSRLPTLAVDPNLFRHLIMNLFENSIKYRSRKDPSIVLRYSGENNEHVFSVEDNGVGIRPEEEKNLFQIYEQGGEKKSGGVGIGLALCRSIIEMHGGRIWVDHEYTQGCKICFTVQPSMLNGGNDKLH